MAASLNLLQHSKAHWKHKTAVRTLKRAQKHTRIQGAGKGEVNQYYKEGSTINQKEKPR